MKNTITLLAISLLSTWTLNAQCPTNTQILRTQTEIDNFKITYPSCTSPNVDIEINETAGTADPITNLDGLSNLISIGGRFRIINTTVLSNVDDMSNLTSIGSGGFRCTKNAMLEDLHGLRNVNTIGGEILLRKNDNMTDIQAFQSVSSISGVLTISKNPLLTELDEFSSLTNIGGKLKIQDCDMLSDISGLNAVTTVGGNLEIFGNALIANLNALSNITTINGSLLRISGNAILNDISGIDNLNASNLNNLQINNNPSLSTCTTDAACNFLETSPAAANVNISGNMAGQACESRSAAETACAAVLPVNFISFSAQAKEQEIRLTWATSYELNNYGFEIERLATSGQWEKIGFTPANTSYTYHFSDQTPLDYENYYRLKQIDHDGQYAFSEIVSVRIHSSSAKPLSVYPNPSAAEQVRINTTANSIISISNSSGQIMYKQLEGQLLDVSGLAPAIYFIKTDNSPITLKFIKLK